jgi:hypothetical protein
MGHIRTSTKVLIGCLSLLPLISACGGSDSDAPATSTGSSSGQSAPTISGQPSSSAVVGQAYAFTPTATGPSGATLTFSATNLPSWLSLNNQSGALSGTPSSDDVGTDSGITLTVSDGTETASLPAFSVTVTAPSSASATVNWTAPTENTDGTALTDLAGFVLSYGQSPSALTQSVQISDPSTTSFTVDNLAHGTWYFGITAVNSAGTQSGPTNTATATL